MTMPVVVRPPPHLAVEDQGIAGVHILHMVIEDIKDSLLGSLPRL